MEIDGFNENDLHEIGCGNPGAIRALSEMSAFIPFDQLIEKCREWKLKGPFLWLLYKDFLGYDFEGNRAETLAKMFADGTLMEKVKEKMKTDARFKRTWEYHIENYR